MVRAETGGGFNLRRRSAALPIVNVIEDDVEVAARQRAAESLGVVPVPLDFMYTFAQVVSVAPVQNCDFMIGFQQRTNQSASNEVGTADHEDLHADLRLLTSKFSELVVIFEAKMSDEILATHPA
jgi:hypothetical protein